MLCYDYETRSSAESQNLKNDRRIGTPSLAWKHRFKDRGLLHESFYSTSGACRRSAQHRRLHLQRVLQPAHRQHLHRSAIHHFHHFHHHWPGGSSTPSGSVRTARASSKEPLRPSSRQLSSQPSSFPQSFSFQSPLSAHPSEISSMLQLRRAPYVLLLAPELSVYA